MNQVLILTTNVLADKKLKEHLDYLGYEVLCSAQLINPLLSNKGSMLLDFPIVVFSETLTNDIVENILKQGQVSGRVLLRIDGDPLNNDLATTWTQLGLTAMLSTEESIINLREILSVSIRIKSESQELSHQHCDNRFLPFSSLEEVLSNFSENERCLFQTLHQEKGGFLTRKEIACIMWNTQPTNSNLAQLSQLINRIRFKLAKYGFSSQCVETHWKKGYRLSEELLTLDRQN